MADINGMQANLGLSEAAMGPVGIKTPSPGEMSTMLSMEASQRQQQSQQVMSSAPLGAPAAFKAQFKAQFERQMAQIQSQQSLNPYAAQMMSQAGQQNPYLPSPLTMTPPSSGVFRAPPPPVSRAPLSPVFTPDRTNLFGPKAPAPMFSSPRDQHAMQQDIRSNRDFASISHAPAAIGFGAGILGGALTGAAVGSQMGGAWGGVIGAGVGGVAAGFSGVAEGVGNLAQATMRPAIQRREMGAGLQNMSRSWVNTGSDISPLGRGLSQGASVNLAGEIQGLSADKSFKKQTGGMFNSQDLMQITRQSGEAGLMDMAQDVPQIKQQLKQTANTIKQFMELTNDPDVSNVIRQMGRMRQFGMTQQDMTSAAQGMKTYSRAAGTSVAGLQQIGGMPGAATFQGAGLTAGQGFQYGNYAAASARQMVSTGSVSPRQLALQGGVQGMAQRDIQGQAALATMPLFAASQAQYGAGGWGVNSRAKGQSDQGALGMVHGAVQSMSQAVQRGGIGALASFPLQQREIADKAMSEMTPQEMTAQKFGMAMNTGRRIGLSGESAFDFGARRLYGDDTAQQMRLMAKSPDYWKSQRTGLRRRKIELGQQTQARAAEDSPIWSGVPLGMAKSLKSWDSGGVSQVGDTVGAVANAIGGVVSGIGNAFGQESDLNAGIIRTNQRQGDAAAGAGVRSAKGLGAFMESVERGDTDAVVEGDESGDIPMSTRLNAVNLAESGALGIGYNVAKAAGTPLEFSRFGVAPLGKGVATAGAALSAVIRYDKKETSTAVQKYIKSASRSLEILDEAKRTGGKKPLVINAMESLAGAAGGGASGMTILDDAAEFLDDEVYSRGSGGENLEEVDYERAIQKAMEAQGKSPEEAKKAIEGMRKSGALSNVVSQTVHLAKKNAKDPELWTETQEKDHRVAIKDQLVASTEARQDKLRDTIEDVEDNLNLDSTFGYTSDEVEEVQKLAAKTGGKGFALRATAAQAFSEGSTKEDRAKWEKASKGMTDKQKLAVRTEVEGMSEDMRDRLKDVSERGTIKEMTDYGKTQHAVGMQGVYGSEGFMESLGKHSSNLEALVAKEGGGELTAKDVAGSFTDEDLSGMLKGGNREQKDLAKLIKKVKGGDKKSAALFEKYAASKDTTSEEGEEVSAAVKGEGKEAQKVGDADAAMEQMQDMFKNFGPATKDLAVGAKALRVAMEADMFAKQQE